MNSFDYDYDAPESGLAVSVDGGPSPFDSDNVIVRVGIQALRIVDEERPAANLTFVIDTSGSMGEEGRLDLVKESLEELLAELTPEDRVAIVTRPGPRLRHGPRRLRSRAGQPGDRAVRRHRQRRRVRPRRPEQPDPGRRRFVDTEDEAGRIFEDRLTSTLVTAAIDARVQVEFDPEVVDEYRLIGFENRGIVDEDFTDDSVDAGELGAGHQVTALASDWGAAPADVRLATTVAALAEILRSGPHQGPVDIDDIVEETDQLDDELELIEVAELAQLADRIAQLGFAD